MIVSLSWLHIVNFISSCVVVQTTFTFHLVVVKWFTLSICYVCTIFHALKRIFHRSFRRYHVTSKSVVSFWGCIHDVFKLTGKFCGIRQSTKCRCYCLFEKLFKLKKNGVFFFGISFFVFEILTFLDYANWGSDDVTTFATNTINKRLKTAERPSDKSKVPEPGRLWSANAKAWRNWTQKGWPWADRTVGVNWYMFPIFRKYWRIERLDNIEAVFFKLGTRNVHHKRKRMLLCCCHDNSFAACAVLNQPCPQGLFPI